MKLFRYKLTIAALLIFAAAIWLLRKDVSSESFLTRDAQIDIANGALIMREQHLGFYLGGDKIGYSRFLLKEEAPISNEESGGAAAPLDYYLFQSESEWRIQAMGMPFDINVRNYGTLNKDLSIRTFQFSFNSSGQTINLKGEVQTEDGKPVLVLNTKSEDHTNVKKLPLDGPVYHTDVIHLLAARDGLKEGARYVYQVYDPLSMAMGDIVVTVEGLDTLELPTTQEKVEAHRIVMDYKGFKATSWVDDSGEVYQENSQVSGIAFTAVREKAGDAENREFRSKPIMPEPTSNAKESTDLIDASRILTKVKIPDPKRTGEMRYTVDGEDGADIPDDGYYQTLESTENGIYTFKTRRVDYSGLIAQLPVQEPPYQEPSSDEGVKPYLEDDALIQSGSPRIRQKALEITQGSQNQWAAAEKIAMWLYINIEKEFRVTIPSALEVLNSMKGDCNEHSTLFAALARSIGIPTKIIAGLVYQDDGLYYHAWNEIYANGHWMPIDSTLNRIEMDAAHIKLAQGALDSQTDIAKMIGNLKVEILDFKEDR